MPQQPTTIGRYQIVRELGDDGRLYPRGAGPYGTLDLSGNVWEWVSDWYDPLYYQNAPRENPQGPPAGSDKVLRGGGFSNYAYFARATNRGFRCVLSADAAP